MTTAAPSRTVRRSVARGAAALACLLVLVGCVGRSSATPAPTATAGPVTLAVSVFQYRSDYAIRGLQIHVENTGAGDITVTAARFTSAFFPGVLSSRSAPSPVFAGSATDFPVILPASVCSARSPEPRVIVSYTGPGSSHGTVTATPPDPFDSLGVIHAQDCSRAAFERIARISVAPHLAFTMRGGKPVSLLAITLTPTGAGGEARLDSIGSTTLLQQPGAQLRMIGATLSARRPPLRLTIDYIPSRCEQHVVAEDKVGTVIPFRVDVGDFHTAEFGVPVGAALKLEYYAYVARYCGW
ncbi:hypothetical protein [Galbitalea soli]|uniref:Uncharacterized protein n=1 Tax=Galbitalea soli TaxID=1268042 RepID=A0A7C9PLY5_9MICO|nr:hypothetical protein [Galbitalea soli]NEM90594.1 hypothetical protein [Galbitalea soli]NYJ31310.1 hypothetical protein [Galbitalea soli]